MAAPRPSTGQESRAGSASLPRRRRPGGPAGPPPDGWRPGGPPVISVLSFGLSVYTLVVANRVPEVPLRVPNNARVAQGAADAWLYLQPKLLSTGDNQQVEVVTDLRLDMDIEPSDGGEPVTFRWDETGRWDDDEQNGSSTRSTSATRPRWW